MIHSSDHYKAPETSILEPSASIPRPFFLFLIAAICGGAAFLFLLTAFAVDVGLVNSYLKDGFHALYSTQLNIKILALAFILHVGLFNFAFAAQSFFVLRGRRGSFLLFSGLVTFGLLIATFLWLPDR